MGSYAAFTAPWRPEAAGGIRQSLRHVIEVRATHPDWTEPMPLDVESGTIDYSETRAPFVQAQLALRVPPTQEQLDMLDPRQGVRVEVDAGYVLDGVRDVNRLATLYLWDRVVSRPSNLVQLTARSAESRIIEWTPLGSSRTFTAASDAGQAIGSLIWWALPGVEVVIDLPAATFLEGEDTLVVGTGDNVMAAIFDIADRVEAWVYEDGLGTWHVTRRPTTVSRSAAALKTGPNGTVRGSDTALTLEDYYNSVLVEHRWTPEDGVERVVHGWAEVTTGPLSVTAAGRRTLKVVREHAASAPTASRAAAAILARTVTRGRSIDVQVGSAPYWVRPGSSITVQLPLGPQERHLVSSVQFDLAATGAANITTRMPETGIAITTGG